MPSPHANTLELPVLVLNRNFQPVRIASVRCAIRLVYTGTAQALDSDGEFYDFASWAVLPVRDGLDDGIAVVAGAVRAPRLVHLRRYGRVRRPVVRLSSRNLMLRDDFQCQYCGTRSPRCSLDIDHVVPRCRGGQNTWTNLVTACQICNRRKGRYTPREANMRLLRKPRAPRWSHNAQLLATTAGRYEEWKPFLMAG